MLSGRQFHIVQQAKNRLTGESFNFGEQNIIEGLNHKSIVEWAWIVHDKDVYVEKDELNDESGMIKTGELKPLHYHVVLKCSRAVDIDVIAKWFGVPVNCIDIPKGQGAFLDCVQYLSHELKPEKTFYPDAEIKSNINFRERLNKRAENKLKYGRDLDIKNQFRHDVLYSGKTLIQCTIEDPLNYMEDYRELKRLRLEYINGLKPPATRLNYYLTGKGGTGKGLMSRALARQMARMVDPSLERDDEMYFIIGAENSTFEGYDGQPVVIWDDMRAGELIKVLGNRGNVFNLFDTHPVNKRQNIKYGSVNLCNTVNIVNSVQPYEEFLDSLAGEYTDKHGTKYKSEDKGQAYRRFPIIIPISSKYLEILGNKGYFENTKEYEELISYGKIRGNMEQMELFLQDKEEQRLKMERNMLNPVLELSERAFSQNIIIEEPENILEFGRYLTPEEEEMYDLENKLEELNREVMEDIRKDPLKLSLYEQRKMIWYTEEQGEKMNEIMEKLNEIKNKI